MKTLILWRRKRARTFKQWGTATADGSACTIRAGWNMAERGDGTLAIVDAPTAEHARRAITAHLAKQRQHIGAPDVSGTYCDGRVIAIGAQAVLAIAGASEAIRHWDARLARDGKVRIADTSALGQRSDGASFSVHDAFGAGFR
jgi:hypothetical protein